MATATESPRAAESPPTAGDRESVPYEMTSDEFFRLIESGAFPAERRVFLWDGRLYEKMAKTVPHATTSLRIQDALRRRLPAGWLIWPENPIRLDPRHAPSPDISAVRGPLDRYEREGRHPRAEDAGLLIEIAASSLPNDLGERDETIARALVPAYWVADVSGRRIIAHHGPRVEGGKGSFAVVGSYAIGEHVPLVLDGREIDRIPVEEMMR